MIEHVKQPMHRSDKETLDLASRPSGLLARIRSLWRADFLSPKDLLRRAALITIFFWLADFAGLREFTSILNGTMGSVELGWRTSVFLGLGYIFLYLAFVLLVPILLLATLVLFIWRKNFGKARPRLLDETSR